MNPLFLAILLLASLNVHARNVQKADCVGPAGAPVKAIYLHGWFSPKAGGKFISLEERNRNQLEALATRLGIRIAIPLAPNINEDNGYREWPATGVGVAANNSLRSIENQSTKACGSSLAPQRTLIGFSRGGFAARDIALSCDDHLRKNYASIIMSGAKARSHFPERNFAGCPKLNVMAGTKEGLNTCDKKKKNCRSFEQVANDMRRQIGGNVVIERFPGGHHLAENDRLSQLVQGSKPTAPPPPVATPPAISSRPTPSITGSSQFIFSIPDATK